jgi:hypothetical protein
MSGVSYWRIMTMGKSMMAISDWQIMPQLREQRGQRPADHDRRRPWQAFVDRRIMTRGMANTLPHHDSREALVRLCERPENIDQQAHHDRLGLEEQADHDGPWRTNA